MGPTTATWQSNDDVVAPYWGLYDWEIPFRGSDQICLSDGMIARDFPAKPIERTVVASRQLGSTGRFAFIYGSYSGSTAFYFCSPTTLHQSETGQDVLTFYFLSSTLGYTIASS